MTDDSPGSLASSCSSDLSPDFRCSTPAVVGPVHIRPRWLTIARNSAVILVAMWLFIAIVSALDVYCSIKYQFELLADEMNPLGRWLMQLDGGSVALFMACKFLGNLVVLGTLQLLYLRRYRLCLLAAAVLTAVQGGLAMLLLGAWG